jgi:SAM-dependent methyltransferase
MNLWMPESGLTPMREAPPRDAYDQMYSAGGYEGIYDLPYRHSTYFPLFDKVLRQLVRHGSKSVLEVGCGTGAFAHLVMERSHLQYRGFDFSEVAVRKAIARTNRADAFFVADATNPQTYADQESDSIVCTEVLEHIEKDRGAMSNWRRGTYCVCSVPNFDADTHVRFFRDAEEVRSRYGDLIRIDGLVRIKKPWLSDISVRSRLRAIRWNRYRPHNLRSIFGLRSFDALGGWFMFHGVKL